MDTEFFCKSLTSSVGRPSKTHPVLVPKNLRTTRPHKFDDDSSCPRPVLSSSSKFEIYLVLVQSRPEDELGRRPFQGDSPRPKDTWSLTFNWINLQVWIWKGIVSSFFPLKILIHNFSFDIIWTVAPNDERITSIISQCISLLVRILRRCNWIKRVSISFRIETKNSS